MTLQNIVLRCMWTCAPWVVEAINLLTVTPLGFAFLPLAEVPVMINN